MGGWVDEWMGGYHLQIPKLPSHPQEILDCKFWILD